MMSLLNLWYASGMINEELEWTDFAKRFPQANPQGLNPVELAKQMSLGKVA